MGKGKILISKSPSGTSAASAQDPNSAVAKKKKKKSSSSETYTSYIFKVLRQVRPNVKITRRAMSIMNSFVSDTFERIANEAAVLCTYSKKETLSSNEVGTAVRLVLPGDLAKYAVIEGVNAVQTYTKDQTTKRPRTASASASNSSGVSGSNKSSTATPSSSGAAGATAGG